MNFKLKLLSAVLALLMAVSLVSCNGTQETLAPTDTPTEAPTAAPTQKPTEKPTQKPTETDPPPQVFTGEVKNLILIIGDGMGPEHIEAGQIFEGETYGFTKWNGSLCNTDSLHSNGNVGKLTDSAASATALATGTLTFNSYLGTDKDGNKLNTIMDYAKLADKSVGVVTTDNLFGATPSGFSAHSKDRNDSDTITKTQAASGVDFLCGLNSSFYTDTYVDIIEENGYYYANDLSDKSAIMGAEKAFLPINIENGKSDSVELKDAASLAIEYLDRDEDGFVLMIEQAHIDKSSHSNDIQGMLARMASLNDTVEAVMAWIGERTDTAVIVTADHETGGLSASSENELPKFIKKGDNTLYYKWTKTDHTQTMVNIYVWGANVDFAQISQYDNAKKIKNTDVFLIMFDILDL